VIKTTGGAITLSTAHFLAKTPIEPASLPAALPTSFPINLTAAGPIKVVKKNY